MLNTKTFLLNISQSPGVYQMLDKQGNVLYVGKARNLKKRLTSYFNNRTKDLKTLSLIQKVEDIDVIVTTNETEAVLLECNLIKKHQPRYNVLLRDDKSYPYILITTETPYPRIDLYRGLRKKNGYYFGPYPSAFAVRETINLLQKIFKIRTCQDGFFNARTRPCLLYQIGRCTGPCVNLISKEEYLRNVQLAILFLEGKSQKVINELQDRMKIASKELNFELAAQYRNQIKCLKQIQEKQYVNVAKGDADIVGIVHEVGAVCIQLLSIRNGKILGSRSYFPTIPPHSTTDEILNAFLKQHYFCYASHMENIPKEIIIDKQFHEHKLLEQVLTDQAKFKVKIICPERGEKKKWLEMAVNSAKVSLTAHLFNQTNVQERMLALQNVLNLKKLERIECFDISHSMGEATVGSCVVFDSNGPTKSAYRRFNIINITPGDDIAAMHQMLSRRFKRLQHEHVRMPELVLIDGGATQLSAAEKVMKKFEIKNVLLVGVSKGPLRKPGYETLHRIDHPPLHLPADSLALHFIQQIRDEAHRFAVTGHRHKRDKVRRQSSLESITGIGATRRRALLRYFGGIQGVAHASLGELTKVPGISQSLAERIFATLHETTI